MSTPGPRPLPSNIRAFTGSRKVDTTREPAPEIAAPDPPKFLTAAGREVWLDTANKLARMRVMTTVDTDLLLMYVETWLRWREATEALINTGLLIKSPNDYPMQNPMLAIINKAQDQLMKIAQEFGFSPSARTRIRQER